MSLARVQVDPEKVITRLWEENAAISRTKLMLEVAYEQLQEELEIAKRQIEELIAAGKGQSKT